MTEYGYFEKGRWEGYWWRIRPAMTKGVYEAIIGKGNREIMYAIGTYEDSKKYIREQAKKEKYNDEWINQD